MNIPVFTPNELENYAAILTWALLRIRKKPFRKNEYVQIRFDADALLLAEETAAHLLEKNLEPVLRLMPTPRIERDYYLMTDVRRLGRVIPGEEELARSIGGTISLFAPASLNHMSSVSAERLNIARRNRAALSKITRERENQGLYTWTLCMYPTQALADAAGMSITEYATQIRKACFLDQPDPVDRWTRTMKEARRIAARLTALGNCALHVESENTDLRFNVGECRKWVGISGRNIPSFEIYVSPDWRTVEGTYRATLPSSQGGNIVRDAFLTFKKGRLASFDASEGQDFARVQTAVDKGAGHIGEFALVDRRFSRIDRFMGCTLYDENHGGPCGSMHIALGQSYSNTFAGDPQELDAETYGFSSSSLHWDLISTEDRRVTAFLPNGKRRVIYENGEFLL